MDIKDRTICPYCNTTNLVGTQLDYIDEYGVPVFVCQLCKKTFTDLSMRVQNIKKFEELKTT